MTSAPAQRLHFHVDARELLLEAAVACPFLPDLSMIGLAVTSTGGHHLILSLANLDRFYFGPDSATVARRSQILIAALQQGTRALDGPRAYLVDVWVSAAWEATLDELTDAIAGDDLADL